MNLSNMQSSSAGRPTLPNACLVAKTISAAFSDGGSPAGSSSTSSSGSPPPRLPPASREGVQLQEWLGVNKVGAVHGEAPFMMEMSKEPWLWPQREDVFPPEVHFVSTEQQPRVRRSLSYLNQVQRQRAFSSSGGGHTSASDDETVGELDDLVSCGSESSVSRAWVLTERYELDRRMPPEQSSSLEREPRHVSACSKARDCEWGVRDPKLSGFDSDPQVVQSFQHIASPFSAKGDDDSGRFADASSAHGAPVVLHVYDFHEITKSIGLPVFHLTVEVYYREYFFSTSGVICCTPGSHGGHMLRESVTVGRTELRPFDVESELVQLSADWPASSYSFIGRNCQGFAAAFCQTLGVGSSFPTRFCVSGALAPEVPGCCVAEHRKPETHKHQELASSESPRKWRASRSTGGGLCSCIGSGGGGLGDLDVHDFCQPRNPDQVGLGVMHPPRRAMAAV